jgi:hypothetical protein
MVSLALAVLVAGVGFGVWRLVVERGAADVSSPVTDTVGSTPVAVGPSTVIARIPPEELIRVDDVWLLDGGNDVYDWGVTVAAVKPGEVRSNVVVDVQLIGADGEVVGTAARVIDGVDADSDGVAIGRLIDPDVAPVRLEFDVSVGVVSNDSAIADLIDVRSIARSGDVLNVRVRPVDPAGDPDDSDAVDSVDQVDGVDPAEQVDPVDSVDPADSGGLVAVFLWRSDDEVEAVVQHRMVGLEYGVDARFAVDLDRVGVPDGAPDEVLWVRGY